MDPTTFSAATLVSIAIVITVLEALALWLYHRRTGRGIAGRNFMPNLLSGLLLMFALRLHMEGIGWPPTAALLAGAGAFHALDLWRRWRPESRQTHAVKRPS